jgi:hypothetical protein
MVLFKVPENRIFDTLTDLKEYLEINYSYKTFDGDAINYETGMAEKTELPKYLFRGESALYDNSLNSMQRMKTDEALTPTDRMILENISIYVDEQIRNSLNLSPDSSAAYLQHYGLYSEFTDFTSDIMTGCRFATGRQSLGKPGRICVMDVQKAMDYTMIFDLKEHPYASRAKHQSAYGIFNTYHKDMKGTSCIDDLGLTWYEFRNNNMADMLNEIDIYKTDEDFFAGYIVLIIDDCIKKHGKVTDAVAKILSDRIDRLPFFVATKDRDKIDMQKLNTPGSTAKEIGFDKCVFYPVSINDLGVCVDVEFQKNLSYKKWSTNEDSPCIKYDFETVDETIEILNYKMLNIFLIPPSKLD